MGIGGGIFMPRSKNAGQSTKSGSREGAPGNTADATAEAGVGGSPVNGGGQRQLLLLGSVSGLTGSRASSGRSSFKRRHIGREKAELLLLGEAVVALNP